MRIFLDANILFSAAKSDGQVRALLRLFLEAGHVLVADGFVIEEARRNVGRKGAAEDLKALDTLLTVVQVSAVRAHAAAAWLDWLPGKDRPVLAAAAAAACEVLVTGDRTHFGAGYGKSFEGVRILSPAMAAGELL